MSRLERTAVYIVVIVSGALLMALEVSAFRIISKTFGAALRETTAVIATFLASMSIGYWAGGKLGDRWPTSKTLGAILVSSALLLLCVPFLDALLSPLIAASSLQLAMHAFVATAVLFSVPTMLFACVSPVAIRLFASSPTRSGSTAGLISAMSTVGSIAGSVLTAFVLIDWLGSIERTVTLVAFTSCACAALLALMTFPSWRHEWVAGRFRGIGIAGGLALILGVGSFGYLRSTHVDASFFKPVGTWRTLFEGDSPYHHVTVLENRKNRMLTFALGAQSSMNVDDPFGPGNPYTDSMHIARLVRPDVRRVLLIGLGGGTFPKQIANYYPDTTIDVVEIDPLVVDVARKYFFVRPDDRLRIHIGDGRLFLKRTRETWDLIVIDAYTTNRYGDTLPPHLVTREFFAEAARHLTAGGIFHFHSAFGGRLGLALQKTAATIFRYTYTTGGEILCSDVAIVTEPEKVLARAQETRAGQLPNLAGYVRGLTPYRNGPSNIPVLTDDYAPVDTLR